MILCQESGVAFTNDVAKDWASGDINYIWTYIGMGDSRCGLERPNMTDMSFCHVVYGDR